MNDLPDEESASNLDLPIVVDQKDIVDRAADQLSHEIKALKYLGDRSWLWIRIVIGLVATNLMLISIIIYGVIRISHTSGRAETAARNAISAKEATRQNCISGNILRQNEIDLWEFALGLPPDPGQTQAQRDRAELFRVKLLETFKLKDCNNIVKEEPADKDN